MPVVTLDFDTEITLSLESQLARLALEASVIGNVIDSFKSALPSLASQLFSQFSLLTSEDKSKEDTQVIKLEFGKVKVKLPHSSFLQQSKTLVSVPEGFNGNLLSYAKALSDMSVEIFQEANKTLGEYNFALSAFITNKESKISLKDHTDIFLRIKARREKLTAEIGSFFSQDTNLSKAQLGDVIERFADLEVLVHGVDTLNTQRKAQNIKDISDSVKKSLDLLKIIIDDTENNGIAQVSGNAALNISTGAYEIGKYVEFIAMYRFRVEQLISCIGKLLANLEENM
jgi:hypothetical protein